MNSYLDNLAVEVTYLARQEPVVVAQLALDTNPFDISRTAAQALLATGFDGEAAWRLLEQEHESMKRSLQEKEKE